MNLFDFRDIIYLSAALLFVSMTIVINDSLNKINYRHT